MQESRILFMFTYSVSCSYVSLPFNVPGFCVTCSYALTALWSSGGNTGFHFSEGVVGAGQEEQPRCWRCSKFSEEELESLLLGEGCMTSLIPFILLGGILFNLSYIFHMTFSSPYTPLPPAITTLLSMFMSPLSFLLNPSTS